MKRSMRNRLAAYTFGALSMLGAANAQDLSARLATVQGSATITAENASRPTQLNATTDRNGQVHLDGVVTSYVNGALTATPEHRITADIAQDQNKLRDPAQASAYRLMLAIDLFTSDQASSPSAPRARLDVQTGAGTITGDTYASAGQASTAPAPSLETSTQTANFGLTQDDERVQFLLNSAVRGVYTDNGVQCDARGSVYKSGNAYTINLAPEPCGAISNPGSATLSLSNVTYSNGVPQAGTLNRTGSTLDSRLDIKEACFMLPADKGQAPHEAFCYDLSTTGPVQVDLAQLAGQAGTGPCVRDATTACLQDGRFETRVAWREFQGNTGPGSIMYFNAERAETSDSAFFWFFAPTNFEMGVKVLNACIPQFENKYWVFTSGLTNVEYTISVRDTTNGVTKTYSNPLGSFPTSIGDTSAFNCQ